MPRLLQCGHTFCHACLEKIKKNSAIECPLDRELTSVKDNDICALRKNFALMAVCSSRQGVSLFSLSLSLSLIFSKGDNFCDFLFASLQTKFF